MFLGCQWAVPDSLPCTQCESETKIKSTEMYLVAVLGGL
jgi:hypothetical protein